MCTKRILILVLTTMLVTILSIPCLADTFVNNQTGETFNGYVTGLRRGTRVQVRDTKRRAIYIDPQQYRIEINPLGRRNQVQLFQIQGQIDLITAVQGFEETIKTAASRGPLFILIEFDAYSIPPTFAQQMAQAIMNIDFCPTVAYVPAGEYNGVFREAAIVALAANSLYMHPATRIGGTSSIAVLQTRDELDRLITPIPEQEENRQAWIDYTMSLAELQNKPPLLVAAMVDESLKLVLIRTEQGDERIVRQPEVTREQQIIEIITEQGVPLSLTAAQAVGTGVADDYAPSRQELLQTLDAADADIIPNRVMIEARREYEQTKERIIDDLETIQQRQQRIDQLEEEYVRLEETIQRISEVPSRPYNSPAQSHVYHYWRIEGELHDLLLRRQTVLFEMLDVLRAQIAHYRNLIEYIDDDSAFDRFEETLIQKLEQTQDKFRQTELLLQYPNRDY